MSMRILLIAALVSAVAVTGCRGGENNGSTANTASTNSSTTASAGGSAADAFRTLAISQCEQTIRANPNAPPGFDASGTCSCAIQTAFGDQADPVNFARSPEGRQALTQAIVSCGQRSMGAAGGQAPAGGTTK